MRVALALTALALAATIALAGALADEVPPAAPAKATAAPAASKDPLAPIAASEWSREKAAHLLRRACFGGTFDEVEALAKLTPEQAVDRVLAGSGDRGAPFEPTLVERPRPGTFRDLDETMRREKRAELRRLEQAQLVDLRGWWIERMATGGHPLEEKMTLFWHGHFCSGFRDVKNGYHLYLQNETLRLHALGSFAELTHAIAKDPAMLEYLDNQRNRKGAPNENFARELMELFTVGIGHYTEQDVKEAARAFTGWGFDGNEFVKRARQHDDGKKKFLGKEGYFDGEHVIEILLDHPATARTIAAKLLRFFVYEDAPEAEVEALARLIRAARYQMKPALRALFLSRAFYSERAIGSQIKPPVDLFVGVFRTLGFRRIPSRLAAAAAGRLGQELFEPPNVKGWPSGRDWISTGTLVERQQMVQRLFGSLAERELVGQAAEGAERRTLRLFDPVAECTKRGLETPEAIVAHFERLLLARPLDAEERAPLLEALGKDRKGNASAFSIASPDAGRRLEAMLKALVAAPQFQLQ